MHACDNRMCVNPDHLSEGTQKRNLNDAIARGRNRPRCAAAHNRPLADLFGNRMPDAKTIGAFFPLYLRGANSHWFAGRSDGRMAKYRSKKFSESDCLEIIKLLSGGASLKDVAKKFGCEQIHVVDVRKGRVMPHLPRPRWFFMEHMGVRRPRRQGRRQGTVS